jgi:hypothetical protein
MRWQELLGRIRTYVFLAVVALIAVAYLISHGL